jgi:two-component system, OmpR family, KDP operon response regulator KdpE
MRVLLVEDDRRVASALRTALGRRGYEVTLAGTAADALAAGPTDLVLLDLGLPGLGGIDVINGLRGWTSVPIIVLSVRDSDAVKVAALDAGADDYVTKPFSMNELLARVRVSLRRQQAHSDDPVIRTDHFTIDLTKQLVTANEEIVHLTPIEWAIVEMLARNPGRLVTQRQLLQQVWGTMFEDQANYLRVHMSAIRRKLEPDPGRPRYFITEPRVGFRFLAEG